MARLSVTDQGRVRESLSRLVTEHARAGLRLHPVGSFTSLSASMDLRVIAWTRPDSFVLVYVDHHDAAYAWAERHTAIVGQDDNLITFIDSRLADLETSDHSVNEPAGTSRFATLPAPIARMLAAITDDDELLEAISALSPEYQEAALSGSTIGRVRTPSDVLVMGSDADLNDALSLPASAWRVFLHPRQRHLVIRPNDRNVLVMGGPGTGKTVVLAHRYAKLARDAMRDGLRPPAFVTLTPASRAVVRSLLAELGMGPEVNLLVANDLGRGESALARSMQEYGSILIDEGQDLPTPVIASLLALLEREAALPPVMIAFDPNQAIVNPTGDALRRLSSFSDAATLAYCYRSTRQIVIAANRILSSLHADYRGKSFQAEHALAASRDGDTARMIAGLSGPEVACTTVHQDRVLVAVEQAMGRLRRAYPPDSLAVVVVSAANPDLTAYEVLADGAAVLRPYDAKGREYLAGVVVDLLDDVRAHDEILAVTEHRYQALSGLYVGVTRFRDRVEVISTSATSPAAVLR